MTRIATISGLVLSMLLFAGCGKRMTITKAKLIEQGTPTVLVSSESERSFSDGLSLFRADQHEAAARYFKEAVENDPSNWQAHYYLGLVYRKQFDGAASAGALHEALTHAPRESRERGLIYLALGELWEQRGDFSRAELSYLTAINLNPRSSRAHTGLKRMEQLSQQIEK